MKRRSIYVFVSTALSMLIPAPGRFVYGVTLVLELNFLILLSLLTNSLLKKMNIKQENSIMILFSVIFGTVLFKEIITLINPEVMLALGFIIYLMPISYFFLGYIFTDTQLPFNNRLRFTFSHILTFSIYALLFFLLRDIGGYGTITFFGPNYQIIEKILLNPETLGPLTFIATIPGALILSSLVLFMHIFFRNNFSILRNTKDVK